MFLASVEERQQLQTTELLSRHPARLNACTSFHSPRNTRPCVGCGQLTCRARGRARNGAAVGRACMTSNKKVSNWHGPVQARSIGWHKPVVAWICVLCPPKARVCPILFLPCAGSLLCERLGYQAPTLSMRSASKSTFEASEAWDSERGSEGEEEESLYSSHMQTSFWRQKEKLSLVPPKSVACA